MVTICLGSESMHFSECNSEFNFGIINHELLKHQVTTNTPEAPIQCILKHLTQ